MTGSSPDTSVISESLTETDLDANPASSTGAENQGVGSALDAVNAALGETTDATPAADEQDSKEPDPKLDGQQKTEAEEISEEELEQFTKSQQHRIRELAAKTKEARGEVETVRQELETIKPRAEQMDQLVGYMRQHEILPDHLNNALSLTAMINKGDYRQALPILEGLIGQVRNAAGEVLPDDLKTQVNLGYITEAHAKELHRARTSERNTVARVQKEREQEHGERVKREQATTVTRAVNAAETWHQEQVTSDPDWNLKRDRVTRDMELELRRLGPDGYPRTESDVRKLLDKVKADVEKEANAFRPTPKAITPAIGGSVSPRSTAKPQSAMDAVNMALSGE